MDPSVEKNINPKKRPASSLSGSSGPSGPGGNHNQNQLHNRNKQRKLAQQTPTYSSSSPSNTAQPNILRTVHPPRFAQSRAFELVALQSTLKRTLDLSKSRAFQKTPRYLRRRAASHNPRKVPRRLRDRAVRELENDPVTPKKRKPKALRRKPRSDFLARQARNGTWLETHLWMAKRFHMRALWGFKVAMRPTQKGARSMYRAAKYASVVHDASYQSVYEFTGPLEDVARLVQAVIDPAGPRVGAKRYTGGKRSAAVEVFDITAADGQRPQLLGPATALWQPLHVDPSAMDTDTDAAAAPPPRTLWLWTHPLIDERLLASLAHTMDTLSLTSVSITQLSDLCKLTLLGPKSFGLLHSTLKLAPSTPAAQRNLWTSLAGLTDPSSLPAGTVLAVDVWDPRLSYPPARPTYTRTGDQQQSAHDALLHLASPATPAPASTLWSADARVGARDGKARDHALNVRRNTSLIPGTRLAPKPGSDSTIPLLLVASPTGVGHDVILPRGWSLPLWRTLVWAGARPAGLACMRSLAHERGTPYFPWDYPTTAGYAGVVGDEAMEQRSKWMARPRGKRVNFDKLMVSTPFMPEWGKDAWLVSRAVASKVGEVRASVERVKQMVGLAYDDALVHVTLTYPGRGAAGEHAIVYAMPNVQRAAWMRIVAEDKWDEAGDVNAGAYVDQTGDERQVVGYVTTGRFALSEGRTKVMGVVKLSEVVGKRAGWVLVRKTSGSVVYPAKVGWVHG